jgi:hypothetical protein
LETNYERANPSAHSYDGVDVYLACKDGMTVEDYRHMLFSQD